MTPDARLPMNLMPSRYAKLERALAGLDETGSPLVAYDGAALGPAGASEDVGLYYVVPWLARALELPLDRAIELFLAGMALGALAVGIVGVLAALRTWIGRLLGIGGLVALSAIALRIGDVYLVQSSVVVATVPWALYVADRRTRTPAFLAFGAWAGLAVGMANGLRSHAGTPVLVFMVPLLVAAGRPWRDRARFAVVVALAVLLPTLHLSHAVRARDAFLAGATPGYVAGPASHPFWHSVYIGFGFLSNDLGIRYLDGVARAKVEEVRPGTRFVSQEYEAVLRREVVRLAADHPLFVARTVAAKAGVVGLYLAVFANVGLVAAARCRKERRVEWAFTSSLAISALPGLLVIPEVAYLLGFAAVATLYGVVSIDRAVERAAWREVLLPRRPERRGTW